MVIIEDKWKEVFWDDLTGTSCVFICPSDFNCPTSYHPIEITARCKKAKHHAVFVGKSPWNRKKKR
jgi:hypothetical protein